MAARAVSVGRRRHGISRRQWLWAILVFVGIVEVFGIYLALNVAPPEARWPAFYATDPATGRLLQPIAGSNPYQTFVLESWLDKTIPFVPLMSVPYLSFLVLVPVAVPLLNLMAGSFRRFLTIGTALIVSQLVLDLAYLLFPTTVLRDAVPGDGVTGYLIRMMWANDQPFNAFPSGHCAWTTIAILSLWRLRGRYPQVVWGLILWLALVFPATVMLRQHYLIDIYAGILVGFSCYWACMFVVERPKLVPRDEDLVAPAP